jgi:hypothetical protein
MKIIRNSAKCTACGEEIESKTRHHFNGHYCKVQPEVGKGWKKDPLTKLDVIVEIPGTVTCRFWVDGGKDYIRRVGSGFIDTSIYEEA